MEKQNSIIKEIISWVMCLVLAALMAYIIVTFVFRITIVSGESMNSTLQNGQILYADKLGFRFSGPNRGDIVILHYPDDDHYSKENFIKRVVGMPGETIHIKDGVVYINGESNVDLWNGEHIIHDMNPVTIPENYYFVMGDNRSDSKDSRTRSVGPIPRDQIEGRILFSMYPFNTFGKLNYKY